MDNFNVKEFRFENEYFLFDATKFPYLYIRFKIEKPNRKQFDEYLYCLNNVILQPQNYVLFSELKETEYIQAEFRKELDSWLIKNIGHINQYCKGAANVVADENQRLLLTQMVKAHQPVYPVFITDDEQKAKEWLEGRV